MDLSTVTDETTLEQLFPADRFPTAKHIFEAGDPLEKVMRPPSPPPVRSEHVDGELPSHPDTEGDRCQLIQQIAMNFKGVPFPMATADLQECHFQMAKKAFNFKVKGEVQLDDVHQLYRMLLNEAPCSSSAMPPRSARLGNPPPASAVRAVRAHVSDPDNPTAYSSTQKVKMD